MRKLFNSRSTLTQEPTRPRSPSPANCVFLVSLPLRRRLSLVQPFQSFDTRVWRRDCTGHFIDRIEHFDRPRRVVKTCHPITLTATSTSSFKNKPPPSAASRLRFRQSRCVSPRFGEHAAALHIFHALHADVNHASSPSNSRKGCLDPSNVRFSNTSKFLEAASGLSRRAPHSGYNAVLELSVQTFIATPFSPLNIPTSSSEPLTDYS